MSTHGTAEERVPGLRADRLVGEVSSEPYGSVVAFDDGEEADMKTLLACGLVVCFAVLASAQTGAPAAIDPPLREAPSLTIIKAKSITLRYADGTPHVMTGLTSFELLGPRVIEADEADVFIDTNEAVLRGSVTMRSAVDEVVARR